MPYPSKDMASPSTQVSVRISEIDQEIEMLKKRMQELENEKETLLQAAVVKEEECDAEGSVAKSDAIEKLSENGRVRDIIKYLKFTDSDTNNAQILVRLGLEEDDDGSYNHHFKILVKLFRKIFNCGMYDGVEEAFKHHITHVTPDNRLTKIYNKL